jgi:magnesium-transporting ATPase (P-type)
VSTLQKTTNKIADDMLFFTASAVLVYFISYFFVFIDDNRMKTITLDYTTALISLVPTLVYLAAILFFYKFRASQKLK